MKWLIWGVSISLLVFYIMKEDSDDYGYCIVSEGGEGAIHIMKIALRTLYRAIFNLCHN